MEPISFLKFPIPEVSFPPLSITMESIYNSIFALNMKPQILLRIGIEIHCR